MTETRPKPRARQLVVLSGKGGTGKTTVVGSFAALAERPVLADADVDAADLHLLLAPSVTHTEDFLGPLRPTFDERLCTRCGACVRMCAYGALELPDGRVPRVNGIACEGCALCRWVCAERAVTMQPIVAGQWFVSDTRFGPLVHARLGIAQENSGKLVTLVRTRAAAIAEERQAPWLLVDGSPGIGCPVIASLAGADAVLIVTEPTLSGKSDLGRVARLAAHFNIPALVCVNKWDINAALTSEIETESEAAGCRVVGRIPYDDAVPRSIVHGVPLVEHDDGPAAQAVRALWDTIVKG
jgi:MinD superfamily P-loop ATPase